MVSLHGFTPSWVCPSLRVVQMCTPPLFYPHQVQGVTQSPCWLSLLCWHWPALLEVKVCTLENWHTVCCVCFYTPVYKDRHCCTPHTLCNMIYIGHPLTYRSFNKALVSRPNPGCTVCMCMYIATQLHMYNCTIYTIVYCVCVYTYMCMYCICIHVLRFIELMYCLFVHCTQLLSMSPWSSKGTVQTSSPSSVDTVILEMTHCGCTMGHWSMAMYLPLPSLVHCTLSKL